MMPKNPLDAILSEVLGDDGGLLMAGVWPEDETPETSTEQEHTIGRPNGPMFSPARIR